MKRMAAITFSYLVGGLVLGIASGGGVEALLHSVSVAVARVIAGICALTVVGIAGALWGRRVSATYGTGDTRRVGRATAWSFGAPVIATGAGLAALEPIAVASGARLGFPIHAVYTILFVTATLVIVASGVFGLVAALGDRRQAARLAGLAGPAAALGFLVVAALMWALGWRVGAPRAAERATMLVVTFLGVSAAALTAGAVLGKKLLPR